MIKNSFYILFIFVLINCRSYNKDLKTYTSETIDTVQKMIDSIQIDQNADTIIKSKIDLTLEYLLIDSIIKLNKLTDSVNFINDTNTSIGKFIFKRIKENYYNELVKFSSETSIPLGDYSHIISGDDSCKILKTKLHGYDTICDFSDGEYYEYYKIKSDWKEKDQILVNFENWEEKHDFLWSKKDGSIYILSPVYELSPDQNKIITYTNYVDEPLYPEQFGVTWIDSDTVAMIIDHKCDSLCVFESSWLNDTIALLKSGLVDYEDYIATDYIFYMMTINQ